MEKRLLNILRCPATHKALAPAGKDLLSRLNAAIESGGVCKHDGAAVAAPLREALVTDDGKRIYPISDGIPVLLESEAIGVEQFER